MSNTRFNDDEDNKSSLPAWMCYKDANDKSKKNRPLYSDEEISVGEALKARVQSAFPTCSVHLNIRQKFLAVKVAPITVRERVTPQYTEMIEYADKEDLIIEKRKSSLIFRKIKEIV